MIKEQKNNSRPEGCICEQFAYLSNLAVYPNSSDITKLCEIAFKEKNEGNYRLKCTPVGKGGD